MSTSPIPRLGYVTIDAHGPVALARWWAALLGCEVGKSGDDYAIVKLPEGGAPLLFLAVADDKAAKNRIHLDLLVDDVAGATARAIELGARPATGELAGPFTWNVLLDPEGNEFCLCPSS